MPGSMKFILPNIKSKYVLLYDIEVHFFHFDCKSFNKLKTFIVPPLTNSWTEFPIFYLETQYSNLYC
jgi:hypothetical protein